MYLRLWKIVFFSLFVALVIWHFKFVFFSKNQVYLLYGLITAITTTLTILCVAIQRRHLMVYPLNLFKYLLNFINVYCPWSVFYLFIFFCYTRSISCVLCKSWKYVVCISIRSDGCVQREYFLWYPCVDILPIMRQNGCLDKIASWLLNLFVLTWIFQVWGLFAPKYVFDAIGLLLTDVLICISALFYCWFVVVALFFLIGAFLEWGSG